MPDKYPRPVMNLMGPISTQGSFPITFANLIAGGFHQVETLDERNAIPAEDPDDPQRRREGMFVYVDETKRLYQLKDGISNDHWEPADLGVADPTKDIVFQLGAELTEGIMEHTEMWVPYTGYIQTVYGTIGMNSNIDSNLLFGIQKWVEEQADDFQDEDGWVTVEDFEIKVDERKKEYNVEIPLDDDKIRIVLISGDYTNVDNMSIIAQFEELIE